MHSFEITHPTLQSWKDSSQSYTLIDIREKEEREAGHMGGSWIPLSELGERLLELPENTVVFYCRSGARSLMAAKRIRELLHREDVYSLAGGMLARP